MLDLARPLEDAVDAHVAHDPLDRVALLAAAAQRRRGLVAAAAADLHEVIDALPRHLRVEETDESIIISGKVSSYYLKQLAQETIMPVRGSLLLINQVLVAKEA